MDWLLKNNDDVSGLCSYLLPKCGKQSINMGVSVKFGSVVVFEDMYLCREHGGILAGAMENLKCNVLKWVRMGFISILKYTKLVGLSSLFHESVKRKRKSGQKTGGAMQD